MASWPKDENGKYLDRTAARTHVSAHGSPGRPDPPRNLTTQSGSRKILVTWDAPLLTNGIVGYRIYTDTESSVLDSLYDPNVRQYSVPATAGSSPPTKNIFISTLTKQGESVKIQVQGKASSEAGAPSDPSPPAGSAASGTTGQTFGIDSSSEITPAIR